MSTLYGRQWLADALKENDPSSVLLFLVGSKKDLSVSVPVRGYFRFGEGLLPNLCRLTLPFCQTPAQYMLMEKDALKVAQEMKAEYWAVSSLTGESAASGLLKWHSRLPGLSFLYLQLCPVTPGLELPLSTHLLHVSGENVREFFFRVAALTFEANVLAELEKSGARRIGDVVRECLPG